MEAELDVGVEAERRPSLTDQSTREANVEFASGVEVGDFSALEEEGR
jgi:hypothetical protein